MAKLQDTNILKALIYLTWFLRHNQDCEARRKLSSSFRTYLEISTSVGVKVATLPHLL
jgi:hypothetical protein